MADNKRRSSGYAVGDWKHFVRFGSLVAAVAGTLVVGALLESDDAARDAAPRRDFVEFESAAADVEDPPLDVYADEGLPLEPAGPEQADVLDRLAMRADVDRERLAGAGGWTLQFMMACDPANVAPVAEAVGDDELLFLLPTLYDDRACFRVCWGSYRSREAALADRGLPAALVEVTDSPQPLPVEQALR